MTNDCKVKNEGETSSPLGASRLTLLFAVAFLGHGIAAQFGLISQPLQFFMKDKLHLTAAQVSSYLAIMMLPWTMKPFYGIVCDFVPLFGYRRKSYLICANAMTAMALGIMAMANSLPVILGCLLVSAVGMAASTAVTVGLAVEAGRIDGKARDYFSLQTICYYSALIAVSLAGGLLCHYLAPESALHVAAGAAAIPVLIVSGLSLVLLHERKQKIDRQGLRETLSSLKQVARSRAFWLVALFIWCWDFSPSFGVPLYFFESNMLKFSQSTIGQLAAWNAAGMVVGAVLYRYAIKSMAMKKQMGLAVLLGTVSTLAYLLLSSQASAIGLELFRGTANMIAILVLYSLSADVCPKGTEVSVMATLIAVRNLATEASTFIGGQLFTLCFHDQLAPLVLVAAATTASCALLIPFLSHHDQKQG